MADHLKTLGILIGLLAVVALFVMLTIATNGFFFFVVFAVALLVMVYVIIYNEVTDRRKNKEWEAKFERGKIR